MNDQNNSACQHQVSVDLGSRSYSIHIGRELLFELPQLLAAKFPKTRHAVIVNDENIAALGERLAEIMSAAGWRLSRIGIPGGEASKCVSQAERIWTAMLEEQTDRGSLVIAVGGGVVGDLAGFAAATFARGIPLVQVPTTLLSQVDSSVGGKTGINLPGAKNIVGAFWQPSLVLIDSSTLDSLPRREFLSGLAEVAKYGVILLPELFAYLESNAEQIVGRQPQAIHHIIEESCRAKAQVVQEDERETSGRRAILNYGHTFAHALESVTGYGQLLHGEAVSIGMHMAALLAERLQRVGAEFVTRQENLLRQLGLPTRFSAAASFDLWQAMQYDKKVAHGQLRFILPSRLGHVELVAGVSEADVREAIEAAQDR